MNDSYRGIDPTTKLMSSYVAERLSAGLACDFDKLDFVLGYGIMEGLAKAALLKKGRKSNAEHVMPHISSSLHNVVEKLLRGEHIPQQLPTEVSSKNIRYAGELVSRTLPLVTGVDYFEPGVRELGSLVDGKISFNMGCGVRIGEKKTGLGQMHEDYRALRKILQYSHNWRFTDHCANL